MVPGLRVSIASSILTPSVTFSAPGDYVLKLVANAPEGTGFDTVKVTALAAPQAGTGLTNFQSEAASFGWRFVATSAEL